MFRLLRCLLCACLIVGAARADEAAGPLQPFARAEIADTKTSVYVGTVTLKMPIFVRTGSTYRAAYQARVFPYFFSSESGRLEIDIPDTSLARLAAGEPIEFAGVAVREDGVERRLAGKATPLDAQHGRIKVRVFVSKRIELIFNSTYTFPDALR